MSVKKLQKHQKRIVRKWRDGMLIGELAKKYSATPSQIRRLIVPVVGEEEYRKVNYARSGRAGAKRKANPDYPEWLYRV